MPEDKVRVPLRLTEGANEKLKTNALKSGCLQTRGAGKGVLPSKSQYVEMLMKPGVMVLPPEVAKAFMAVVDFVDLEYGIKGEYPEVLSEALGVIDSHFDNVSEADNGQD